MARSLVLFLCAVLLGHACAQYGAIGGVAGGVAGAAGAGGCLAIRAPGKCYGHARYDAAMKQMCCSGNAYGCAKPGNMVCCGKHLVDKTMFLCCSKDPMPKGGPDSPMKCCDKTPIDLNVHGCCDGEVVFKMNPGEKTYCCGKKSIDPNTQVCCNRDVVFKADAPFNLACTPGNDAITGDYLPPMPPTGQGPPPKGQGQGQGHGHGGPGHNAPSNAPHPFVHGPPPPHGHPPPHPHGHPPHGHPPPPPHGHPPPPPHGHPPPPPHGHPPHGHPPPPPHGHPPKHWHPPPRMPPSPHHRLHPPPPPPPPRTGPHPHTAILPSSGSLPHGGPLLPLLPNPRLRLLVPAVACPAWEDSSWIDSCNCCVVREAGGFESDPPLRFETFRLPSPYPPVSDQQPTAEAGE